MCCAQLDVLAALQSSRKEIALGPRPGKLKSNVRAPEDPNSDSRRGNATSDHSRFDSAESSADELVIEPPPSISVSVPSGTVMINLDSSDVE